jgi:hypothetical protein
MIAQSHSAPTSPNWHDTFLAMVPVIKRCAMMRFRHLPRDANEDAVEDAVANCCVA